MSCLFLLCSVFAGVAEPDDDSDSEPKSNSDHACEVRTDEPVIDQKLKESLKEVRELQLKDPDLALYLSFLESNTLPDNDGVAKRIVLESRRMEVIDGVLYCEGVCDSH